MERFERAGHVALALLACVPLFLVKYPPIQDMPVHLAAIRVIHSFHDPAYGFQNDFVLELGRTQYVLYHLLGSLLSYVLSVAHANLVLVGGYLVGSVLAMRKLLETLGRDALLCVAVVPLLFNVMFLLGLLPFLLGIPVMLWAIAVAVVYLERPTLQHGVLLGVLGTALFTLHVFPYGLFGVAFAAFFPWRRPAAWTKAVLPVVPSLALQVYWAFFTPAGRLARGALFHPEIPSPLSPLGKIRDSYNWLGDVYRDLSDEAILGALATLAIVSTVLAWRGSPKERATAKGSWARFAVVPAVCLALIFLLGDQQGHFWLIWQRFPLLLALTLIPLLRVPVGAPRRWIGAGLVGVALAATVDACIHWVRFERDDVADFDEAMKRMLPRRHVAGLIYNAESSVVFVYPFVHFVSYYQVEKGGVVEFTFAGRTHWPYTFRPDRLPPEGAPTRLDWEWHAEKVTSEELWPYFDYVLTRAKGFEPAPGTFRLLWEGRKWKVWEKEASGPDQ